MALFRGCNLSAILPRFMMIMALKSQDMCQKALSIETTTRSRKPLFATALINGQIRTALG
jgi:hypothetical protein